MEFWKTYFYFHLITLNKHYSENFYQTNWNCNLAKHLTKLLSSLTTLEYIIPNTEHLVDFLEQQKLSDDCEFISFDVTSLLMIASLFHLMWQVYLQAYTVAHYWCYPSKNLWRKTGIYKHTKTREKLSSLTVYKKCSFYIQRKMLPRARWWCCHKFVFGSCNYWNLHGRAWEDDSTIMDIIVWQKVKNTSPPLSMLIQ